MTQEFDLGVHYFLRGDYRRALRLFRDVIHVEPHHARAHTYLGMCHAHLGEAAEAEAALSRALQMTPQNGEAWFHLGIARSLRSEWPEAANAYRHAVALLPQDMIAWHRLGVSLAESGDRDGASAAFERALVLSRETGKSIPEGTQPAPESDSHLTEAGEREGTREAESWLDLALSLLSLGEEEEAITAYERAYTLDPKRARHSLFRPMLELLLASGPAPAEDDADGQSRRPRPQRPTRPETPPTEPEPRPEVH
ncbi:MAG TPA: tetratricopeptide repeat protein [Thermoplasmata archaeon]|nr:tetratricopeptide repeat protein [Thermoplasmata archaeon]